MSSPSSVRDIWIFSDGTAVDVSSSTGAFPLRRPLRRHSKSVRRKCRLLTRNDLLFALPDGDCCLAMNVAETLSRSSHLDWRFGSEVDAIVAAVPMHSKL